MGWRASWASTRRAERAIADALAAAPRRIDVGEIGGRLFVNIAGIGFDAHVAVALRDPANAARIPRLRRRSRRATLLSYVPLTYTHHAATVERRRPRACSSRIANSAQFGNGARIAPRRARRRWRARSGGGGGALAACRRSARLPRLFNGTVDRLRGCTIAPDPRSRRSSADQPMTFHVDGEPVVGGTRLRVRVHPGALRVAVR